MNVSTKDLLDLLAKAGELDLSIFVKQDKDGDYVVKFYELFTDDNSNEQILVIQSPVGWSQSSSGTCSFEYLMDTFVDMLSKKKEKLKSQKRQELLTRLTTEELELLGVVK